MISKIYIQLILVYIFQINNSLAIPKKSPLTRDPFLNPVQSWYSQ